jgi:hypothetical protein
VATTITLGHALSIILIDAMGSHQPARPNLNEYSEILIALLPFTYLIPMSFF